MSARHRGSNSLAVLAAQINDEDAAVAADLQSAVQHAMAAGEALIEAKVLLPHGEWTEWLASNCPSVSGRTARLYMQLARNQEALKTARHCQFDDCRGARSARARRFTAEHAACP